MGSRPRRPNAFRHRGRARPLPRPRPPPLRPHPRPRLPLPDAATLPFLYPLNTDRRFIPRRFISLSLDGSPIKPSLAHFLPLDRLPADREQTYASLPRAGPRPSEPSPAKARTARGQPTERVIQLDHGGASAVLVYAFSPDGGRALSGGRDNAVRLWEVEAGRCLRVLEGHTAVVGSVARGGDRRHIFSGDRVGTIRT